MIKLPTLKDCLKLSKEELKEVRENINKNIIEQKTFGYKEEFFGEDLQSVGNGIPIAIKDNINVEGLKISCASNILKDYVSSYDATVITNLKNNGFSPYGITNMDEFAMGSTTANSVYGKTLNPHNKDCVPGGSSGGSASVVASGTAVASLGSDTGGSIRQPAAFCGVVGFKPSYGHVSRNGLIAYSSSLDQVGPITQNVEDCAILYDAIKGYDKTDTTSIAQEYLSTFKQLDSSKKYKIAVVREYIDNCEEGLKKDILDTVSQLKEEGHEITEISLFDTDIALSSYYILATAEASSNLARFDGIRYGNRAKDFKNLNELYVNTRSEGFGEEVKKRILLGTYVLSSGYYDAYYNKAKKIQNYIVSEFYKVFNEYDLIIMPVAPTTAFEFDKKLTTIQMYLNDIYTIAINISGLPAMSLPLGKDEKGLPTALQVISKKEEEQKIFNLGLNIEGLRK